MEDLPDEVLQDPTWERSGRTARGRDGCRVPLPWRGDAPPFGFGPDGSRPWLPQPEAWRALTAEAQEGEPASVLSLYRAALRLRRSTADLQSGDLRWQDCPPDVLDLVRGSGFRCVVNLSQVTVPLPEEWALRLASDPGTTDALAPDTAAWLAFGHGP